MKILALIIFSFVFINTHAAQNFVSVKLPKQVSVELPGNWTTLSTGQRTTLDTSVQSRMEKIRLYDASSELSFAANYYDDSGKAAVVFNIRYYPQMELTQSDSVKASKKDIEDMDGFLHQSINDAGAVSGYSVVEWKGTHKEEINGHTAFVTEYTRSALGGNGVFCVRLVRFLNGNRSHTITISYRQKDEYILRPICDRVIRTIKNDQA